MRLLFPLMALMLMTACASLDRSKGYADVTSMVQQRTGADIAMSNGVTAREQIADRVTGLLKEGLTRKAAVAIALINNQRLLATYESLGVSQADLLQAGLLRNPGFSIDVGFPLTPNSLIEWSLSLVQDLLELFVLPSRKEIAAQQFTADVHRVSSEAFRLATEVESAVIELQAATRLVQLRTDIVQTARASRDLAAAQFEAGNIYELTLTNEEAAYQQQRLELAQAEIRAAVARERINTLLGLSGADTQWILRDTLQELPAQDPDTTHAETVAIKNRLDLEAARLQVDVFTRAAAQARTFRFFGSLEVGATIRQDTEGPRMLGPSLRLEIPLFDQRQAVIGRLEAQAREASQLRDALAVEARSAVRTAAAEVLGQRQRVSNYEQQLLPLRHKALQLTQLQYNAMQVGLFQLMAARQLEIEAMTGHIDALKDYWLARTHFSNATGRTAAARAVPETDSSPVAPQ